MPQSFPARTARRAFCAIKALLSARAAAAALLPALAPLFLTACGPKEIGEGSSYEAPAASGGAAAAENMRYPMTGVNATQQKLYYYNKPDVAQNYRDWRLREFRRMMGVAPDPEDAAYREKPRQRSPFRQ